MSRRIKIISALISFLIILIFNSIFIDKDIDKVYFNLEEMSHFKKKQYLICFSSIMSNIWRENIIIATN